MDVAIVNVQLALHFFLSAGPLVRHLVSACKGTGRGEGGRGGREGGREGGRGGRVEGIGST